MSRRMFLISCFIIIYSGCFSQLKQGRFSSLIDGLKITYTVRGHGPVMIAGHLNSGGIGYELTLQPLEKYFTMVYYNPRGTADSDAPQTLLEYHNEYIVKELEGLRRVLGVDKIWLFGHSDQSLMALEYSIDYPSHTAGLVLTGTHYIISFEEDRQARIKFEEKRKEESPWFRQVCADWDYMFNNNTSTDSSGRDLTDAPVKWWCYNEETSKKVIPIVAQITKAGRRKAIDGQQPFGTEEEMKSLQARIQQYKKLYGSIERRVLIINGAYDTNNPPHGAEILHKALKKSDLFIVPKAGHFPWVEQPAAFFSYFDRWWKRLSEN